MFFGELSRHRDTNFVVFGKGLNDLNFSVFAVSTNGDSKALFGVVASHSSLARQKQRDWQEYLGEYVQQDSGSAELVIVVRLRSGPVNNFFGFSSGHVAKTTALTKFRLRVNLDFDETMSGLVQNVLLA